MDLTAPTPALPTGCRLTIELPNLLKYDSSELIVRYNGGVVPSSRLGLYPDEKLIEIKDITDTTSANIMVQLENLQNHQWASSPGNFVTKLWANGTNTILYQGSQSSPVINNQVIVDSTETLLVTNFGDSNYMKTLGDTVNYEI